MTTFMAFGLVVGRLLLLTLLGGDAAVGSAGAPAGDPAARAAAGSLQSLGKALLPALPAVGSAQFMTERGFATSFGSATDLLAGGAMACSGRYMKPGERVCAHRTLPCGTVVMVQSLRTKKVTTCTVMDRGPYGAELPNGEIVLKVRPEEEGTWRGVIDLSPTAAAAIGLTGRERVTLIYHRDPRRRPARPGAQIRWARAEQPAKPLLLAAR